MKLVDSVFLDLIAGNGGNGKVSFFQDWHQARPHPDGGNGGNGGNIIFVADNRLNTFDFSKKKYRSLAGQNGDSKNRHGKNGVNLICKIPIGTLIWTADKKFLLCNFTKNNQEFIVARGGIGGKGNAAFLSNHNRIPRTAQPGTIGETKTIFLELKLLANIGLFGLPNAGKSSLLNALTNAKSRVANYSFTTLQPNLGALKNQLIISDLPGIIEGAHLNRGLGNRFLKHVERCELLIYVVDLSKPWKELIHYFETLLNELFQYNSLFKQISFLIVGNKIDLSTAKENETNFIKHVSEKYPNFKIIIISALKKSNLPNLIIEINRIFKSSTPLQTVLDLSLKNHPIQKLFEYNIHKELRIQKLRANTWLLSGKLINNLFSNYDLSSKTDLNRLNSRLKELKIDQILNAQNVRNGDTIFIQEQMFTWKFSK